MSYRLATDYPNPSPSHPPTSQRPHSAYFDTSKSQHYDHDHDQEEVFDVRADFDGHGPRWSEVYGSGVGQGDESSYRPVEDHIAPSAYSIAAKSEPSREELVSVPVLGPEWKRAELQQLSRRGLAEVRREKRTRAWKEWTRDQRGMCGIRWMTRRTLVFVLFAVCAGLIITLYFLIPRAPTFSFYQPSPFSVDNVTIAFSRTPTNFSFTGNLNLLADATSSYVPVHFSNLEATLYDLDTDKAIAKGNYGNHVVAKKQNVPVVVPIDFSYSAINASDTTWLDMYNACGHLWPGTTRSDLKFRIVLRMSIIGVVTHPEMSTQISDVACPFELPADSV